MASLADNEFKLTKSAPDRVGTYQLAGLVVNYGISNITVLEIS